MKRALTRATWAALLAACLQPLPLEAAVVPNSPLAEKSFRQDSLHVPELHQPVASVAGLSDALQLELAELGVQSDSGFYDSRVGRWSSLILSEPLIPGTGVGNNLRWVDLAGAPPRDETAVRDHVWNALRGYLLAHQAQLKVDLAELSAPRISVLEDGQLIFVWAQRQIGGIPVRDTDLTATINHGNLVLLGLRNWADIDSAGLASVSEGQARSVVERHLSPFAVERFNRGQRLELIPTLRDGAHDFRLAWAIPVKVRGDLGSWEALVDAGNGDLLAFEDRNQYAQRRVIGGVYPVSNDQRPPDGVEQVGWPMPFANLTIGANTITTSAGGTFGCAAGNATFAMAGPFVRMSDGCGAASEQGTGDLDLGSGPAALSTDCAVPVGRSAGDTKSSRSGFYELNRIIEQAKGYLPANAWLQGQLTSNMNIVNSCNAFWNGSTVNFYRDSAQCRNTGEIAAIFDHEWGHGMDNNGTNPTISGPGEGIADIHAFLRLNDSCVGRGFFKTQTCGGYGDPCDGTPLDGCTGVRDIDWMRHACDRPHTVTWVQSGFTAAQCNGTARPACPAGGGTPCGRATHCEGYLVGETAFDLARRDLTAPPFSFDFNTAHELATRLFFLGSQAVGNWYTCNVGGGCGATGGYLLVLAADDDNGNINDGTPHMQAIRAAFERHEIHCATPAVANTGCAGGPTAAPTVTATPIDSGVNLSWTAVAGASRYNVYRTEGVAACNFGKIKIGETTGTSFSDQGLLNGRPYSYIVVPVGSNLACWGRASACTTATPVPGPNLGVRNTFTVSVTGGDGDEFLDNCESANVGFTVENIGTGNQTNVRLVSVTPVTHPGIVVNTTLPAPIAPSLADCASANGTFNITANGLAFNDTTELRIEVTSDQLAPATRTAIVRILNTESNWTNTPTRTFNFDTNFEGWTIQAGTWSRLAGGANGTPFHVSSSQNLADQCDVIRSPLVRLKANSTLSTANRYAIEPTDPTFGPYDRANVGVVDVAAGTRTVVSPSSGQLYTLPGGDPNGTCGTTGQAGWNATSPGFPTFTSSTWSAAALNPGGVFTDRRAQLEIRYGTDPFIHFQGFHFDQLVLTNFDLQGADTQPNTCGAVQSVAPFALTVDQAGNRVFQPNETVTVAPNWRNTGNVAISLTGAASNFTGPAGPAYTIADGSASYGSIAVGANQDCSDCYSLGITSATRPTQHWDATVLETVTPTGATKTWTLHVGDSFTDVPASNGFYRFIETIFHRGITGGCGTNIYCPTNPTAREQMAVFVLASKEGTGYNPPACVAGSEVFADVPASSPFCRWIEELFRRQVVAGCGGNNYCPQDSVTRAQMSIFVLRTLDPTLNPPACVAGSEMFNDVPASNGFCRWIEELARRQVVTGCGGGAYCPNDAVTREQMGVFLTATFSLTLYGL